MAYTFKCATCGDMQDYSLDETREAITLCFTCGSVSRVNKGIALPLTPELALDLPDKALLAAAIHRFVGWLCVSKATLDERKQLFEELAHRFGKGLSETGAGVTTVTSEVAALAVMLVERLETGQPYDDLVEEVKKRVGA